MDWFKEMLSDGDGIISSKRVITFLAFILCGIAFLSNLFWKFEVRVEFYDAMMYIVVAGLGFTASEKFTLTQGNKK